MSKKKEPAAFAVEAKRTDLLLALTRAAAAIERRTMLPILSYASLAMGFGTLAVTGTNLDHEVRVEIEAKGKGAGTVVALGIGAGAGAAAAVARGALAVACA